MGKSVYPINPDHACPRHIGPRRNLPTAAQTAAISEPAKKTVTNPTSW